MSNLRIKNGENYKCDNPNHFYRVIRIIRDDGLYVTYQIHNIDENLVYGVNEIMTTYANFIEITGAEAYIKHD